MLQIISCTTPNKETTYDDTSILEAVMNAQGGKNNWNNIQQMSYKKSFALFAENGDTEKDIVENHSYNFTNGTNRKVSWTTNDTLFEIHRSDTDIYQTKNGSPDPSVTPEKLQSKLNAATFVVGLPYTLDDPNSTKVYEGIQKFQEHLCHTLKVTFKGSDDIWRLFYSKDDLSWKGYWVKTSDHYSLIINEEMHTEKGFVLCTKRKSFRTDDQKNILYLRATYLYEDYVIK